MASSVPILNLIKAVLILVGMAFAAGYSIYRQDPQHVFFSALGSGPGHEQETEKANAEKIQQINYYADDLRASANLDWSVIYRGGAAQRSRVAAAISEASDLYKIDQNLIRSVIMAESMFDPRAVSEQGAKGLMQLMPKTAEDLGVQDVFNVRENIFGGTLYLNAMLKEFHGQLSLALAGYHSGPQAVKDAGNSVPLDSRKYVALVASYYKLFGVDSVNYRDGIYSTDRS